MALIVQTTNSNSGIAVSSFDVFLVIPNVYVAASNSNAVVLGDQCVVENYGVIVGGGGSGVAGISGISGYQKVINGIGGVIVGGASGLSFEGNYTVENYGAISSTSLNLLSSNSGISTYGAGTIINNGSIGGTFGIQCLSSTATDVVITSNFGTITGTAKSYKGSATARNDVGNAGTMNGDVQLGNHERERLANSGTINGNVAFGTGSFNTAENSGTINGRIKFANTSGGTSTVVNDPNGLITVNNGDNAVEVLGNHAITNRGQIVANGAAAYGIWTHGSGVILNYGSITAAQGFAFLNYSGIASDIVTTYNYGAITGSTAYQSFGAVGLEHLVNVGTMNGAIQFGNHAFDSLVNSGTINGNILYGSGANDSLENTGTINGTVNISNGGIIDNALGGRIATANDPGAALYVFGTHTITNRGEIIDQGLGGRGIDAPGAGTIWNYGSIAADTAVYAVNLTATDVMTLFNYGAMTGNIAYNAGGSAAQQRVVNAGAMTGAVTLSNHAGDRLENSGTIAGAVTFGGASGLLTNSGAINGAVTITDGFVVNETGSSIVNTSGIGSAFIANGAHSLVNRGAIASQGASGVGLATNKSGVTYNYGSITGGIAIQRGFSFTADVVTLHNYGEVTGSAAYSSINFGSSVAEWIFNAGTMTGSISLGNGAGDRLDNDGTIYGDIALGSGVLGSLQNTGAIHGNINFAQSGGGANDKLVNDGDIYGNVAFGGGASTSVQNTGTIRGNVTMGNGAGATLVNSGSITGDVALGNGNNDYVQNRGVINGNVVLGSGTGDVFDSSLGDVFGNIFGGDGGNTLIGGRHGGGIYGGLGNDVIRGGNVDPALSGAVTFIDGGTGYNALYGGTGDTIFVGGEATLNYIQGGSGHNSVDYSTLDDVVQVKLNLNVGYVNNLLTDTIYGVQDVIGGHAGDIIIGDAFANRITAGAGFDILTGGGGADIFAYNSILDSDLVNGYDQITDFQTGIDKIDISALHTNASHVQIFSGGGSTVLYTYNAVSGQAELALAFTGANVIAVGDVIF